MMRHEQRFLFANIRLQLWSLLVLAPLAACATTRAEVVPDEQLAEEAIVADPRGDAPPSSIGEPEPVAEQPAAETALEGGPAPDPTPVTARLAPGQLSAKTRAFRWEICVMGPFTLDAPTKVVLQVYPGKRPGERCPTEYVKSNRIEVGFPHQAQWLGDPRITGETREIGPAAKYPDRGLRFEWLLTPRSGAMMNIYLKLTTMTLRDGSLRDLQRTTFNLDGPQGVLISSPNAPLPDPVSTPAPRPQRPDTAIQWIIGGVVAAFAALFSALRLLASVVGDTEKVAKFWQTHGANIRSWFTRINLLRSQT